jgi:hypothetical protein
MTSRWIAIVLTTSLVPQLAAAQGGTAPPPGEMAAPPAPTLESLQAKLEELQHTVADQANKIVEMETMQEVTSSNTQAAPVFDLHGFIDMGAQRVMTNDDTNFESTSSTFVLGNINIYFAFNPSEHWSSLTEVRFTTAPDGQPIGGNTTTPSRINTQFTDPANGIGDDQSRWGALVLERSYIQYQGQKMGVRVGEFLTPFGIWNVDHGSPTIVPIVRPESMTQEMFPKHQLGVELFGTRTDTLVKDWDLEYHAYISNGRTPGQVDPTEDKMIGGRAVLSTLGAHHMAFGVSAMYGNYTDQQSAVDATGQAVEVDHVKYREIGLSADASMDFGALRLRTEITSRNIHYESGKHDTTIDGLPAPNEWQADFYLLAAYRVPKTRFEPYLYTETYRAHDIVGDLQIMGSAGLNVYFTPAIQLKFQALYSRFFDTNDFALRSGQEYEMFVGSRLVMGL